MSRAPRRDDCPHCGGSNWRTDALACHCALPDPVVHTHQFWGTPVQVGRLEHQGCVDINAHIRTRRDLFQFISGMEFHLKAAQRSLQENDALMRKRGTPDGTCAACGFLACACVKD